MPNYYKLRCDHDELSEYDLLENIDAISQKYMYCIEEVDGKNKHTHWYIETDIQMPALRARVRSLGYVGNGTYSLKTLDEETPVEYLAYLVKGGKYWTVGVSSDLVENAKNYDKKMKENYKNEKKKKKNIISCIISELGDFLTRSYCSTLTQETIARRVLQYHLDNDLLVRDYTIHSLTTTILCRYYPEYKDLYLQNLTKKINFSFF